MFGLGGIEVLVILLVGVVVLGPERLPKVMRSFTKVMSEFRRISTDLQRTINSEIHLEEYNRKEQLGINKPVKKKKSAPKPSAEEDGESALEVKAEPDAERDAPQPAEAQTTPPASDKTPDNVDKA